MSLFDKKFQEILIASPEYEKLLQRVVNLEAQVVSLTSALQQAMKAYTDLARITIDNRKSLEELYAYVTDPMADPVIESPDSDSTVDMTPEELAAYKRNLN